jgi:hypothetical protein
MGTHETQRRPEDVAAEASEYMNLIRLLLVGAHRDIRFILNMDQTPCYFAMTWKRTLEVVGVKTVHIRTSTNDTKRATVAVTIAGDGTVLPSMVVFKGQGWANMGTAGKLFSRRCHLAHVINALL